MFKRASGNHLQQDDFIDIDKRLAPYVSADPAGEPVEPELAVAAGGAPAPIS
jgi:hypothetical protein